MLWHVLISLAEDSHFSCALTAVTKLENSARHLFDVGTVARDCSKQRKGVGVSFRHPHALAVC